ncbi:unnamed protein product [Ceratitis capitata]|uniref:(Mediterranean fruit fly) hypothetical protein n=1 Tax=Ceratitis capitata TaxID=7213 RepID=A0A811VB50_CERCA|nr:unnamed protein product [Ceratitis capitata]
MVPSSNQNVTPLWALLDSLLTTTTLIATSSLIMYIVMSNWVGLLRIIDYERKRENEGGRFAQAVMQLDGGPQQRQRGTHVDSKNQRSTRFDRSSISEAAASTAEAPKQQPHLPWQCPRSSSVRSAACVAELANSKIHRCFCRTPENLFWL